MRKATILAAAAALAVGMLNLSIAAVPASAAGIVKAVPGYTDRTNVQLCDAEASPLCMNGYDGSNEPVHAYPDTPGDAQDLDIVQLNNCGGTVTVSPACPWAANEGPTGPGGLSFNRIYEGDVIVGITDAANSMAFRADNSDLVESLTGSGQVWVQAGNLVGSNAGALFVNVDQSVAQEGEAVACDDGPAGDEMSVDSLNTVEPYNDCAWHVVT